MTAPALAGAGRPGGRTLGQGAAFRLDGVRVTYPRSAAPALDGVSIAIEAGEALALVGPSGAGKSTLLALLNGSLRPSSGRVLVGGTALSSHSAAELRSLRARLGIVPQEYALVPNLRVIGNVLCGGFGRQSTLAALRSLLWPSRSEARAVHALLERVGVGDKLYERADRLSGGQRQRVAIARALYQQPIALLADEPVSSVDPARAADTLALLLDLSRERGLTLIASLHDLELARRSFPRLVGLREGRVAFDAPPGALGDRAFDALYRLDAARLADR